MNVVPFEKLTSVFAANYEATQTYVVNEGGSSSSKTWSILQTVLMRAIENDKTVTTVVGQDIPNLKKGSLRDFENILFGSEFFSELLTNYDRSNRVFTFANGSIVEFNSYDNAQDAKNGKRDYLFANEANGIPYPIFNQLALRTKKQVFIDYNPDAAFWVHNKLLTDKTKSIRFIRSTFKNNPFIPKNILKEILSYEFTDPYRWQVYGLGIIGKLEGLVFKHYNRVPAMPTEYKWRIYGMDFGFSNDPTTLIDIRLASGELWLDQLIFKKGLTNPEICKELRRLGIGEDELIIADSAEPKSIKEIRNEGFRIKGAIKGSDSIRNGISAVDSYPLNVTHRSLDMIEELDNYKYIQDRNGDYINKPIDSFNHTIDPTRYGVTYKTQKGESRILSISS